MKKEEIKIYEGCAASTICKGICRELYLKRGCSSFYRYKLVPRKNKSGKILNRFTQVEVR